MKSLAPFSSCFAAALTGAILLAGGLSTLTAQSLSYVRDLPDLGFGSPMLPVTQAPVNTSDPLYVSGLADTPWFFSANQYRVFDVATGTAGAFSSFPTNIKIDGESHVAQVGVGTSAPLLNVVGARNTLWRYDQGLHSTVGRITGNSTQLGVITSVAAPNRDNLTVLADGGFHSINTATGGPTTIFSLTGGTSPGQFSFDTAYHAYSPNGLVYLLDFGNARVQSLDPANNFAFVSGFSLQSGITTANLQFAIDPTGNLYFGDGAGGGSAYGANGSFLSSFALPGYVTGGTFLGISHLRTDLSGYVYVFDSTGQHQYLNATAVPEPATTAVLAGIGVLALAIARRRKRTP